jgi:hypothetical protein
MSKQHPANPGSGKSVAKYAQRMKAARVAESWARYPKMMALLALQAHAPQEITLDEIMRGTDWVEMAQWWPFRLIQEVAAEGDAEGCKRMLAFFLPKLKVHLPPGVLARFQQRGRPNETAHIYEAWVAQGQPRIRWRICEELAKEFYPIEYGQAKANPRLRKKLRDRVRSALWRNMIAQSAAESEEIS